MSRLKPPIHVQQMAVGYCLPACGQMALEQLGQTVTQDELAAVMGTVPGYGTPFSRIERLSRWQVVVEITEWAGIEALAKALTDNKTVIVALLTNSDLAGWSDVQTQHTVLIGDITPAQVSYYDPALPQSPVIATRDELLLAWSDMDEKTAICWRP